jgi:hypothetical protein
VRAALLRFPGIQVSPDCAISLANTAISARASVRVFPIAE